MHDVAKLSESEPNLAAFVQDTSLWGNASDSDEYRPENSPIDYFGKHETSVRRQIHNAFFVSAFRYRTPACANDIGIGALSYFSFLTGLSLLFNCRSGTISERSCRLSSILYQESFVYNQIARATQLSFFTRSNVCEQERIFWN